MSRGLGDVYKRQAFILYEKFCSDSGEQRREQFKKAFERYLTDALQNDTPIPLQDGA